jgi:hypothetical protein
LVTRDRLPRPSEYRDDGRAGAQIRSRRTEAPPGNGARLDARSKPNSRRWGLGPKEIAEIINYCRPCLS